MAFTCLLTQFYVILIQIIISYNLWGDYMKTKKAVFFSFILLTSAILSFYIFNLVNHANLTSGTLQAKKAEFTIIIDAGHGGADGGAVAADGTAEKVINLQISQYLEKILNSYGVKTIMTRTTDDSIHTEGADTLREKKVSDIHNRMAVMENTENAVFVSIHQNKFSNSTLWGTQVFYSPNTTESAELADLIQTNVRNMIQPDNKRVIKKSGSSIYLLYNAKKTAVLVECGFVSNPEENEKLKMPDYQKKMAFSIACGIIEYLNTKVV